MGVGVGVEIKIVRPWKQMAVQLVHICRKALSTVYLARAAPKRRSFILRPASNQNLHSSHTINKKNRWPPSRSAGLRDGRWLRWASLRIRVSHRCGLLSVLLDAAPVLSQLEVIEWKWRPSYGHLLHNGRDWVSVEKERDFFFCLVFLFQAGMASHR